MISLLTYWLTLPYLRWHIIFTFIPLIILWSIYWRYLLRYKKTILLSVVLSVVWGFPFEFVARDMLGIWHFNQIHNLGITFLGLPLEEYFFLVFLQQELAIVLLLKRKRFIKHE